MSVLNVRIAVYRAAMKTDVTGWCDRAPDDEHHQSCDGTLRTATGLHWWCACPCHPEPEIPPVLSREGQADADKALAVWKSARAANAKVDEVAS